jgi:hypothetical protein
MWQNLIDIFTAPKAVFARLMEKPTVLVPMLLVALAVASINAGYIATSDQGFFVDQVVEQSLSRDPTMNETQLRAALENVPKNFLLVSSSIGALLGYIVMFLVIAAYLNFMGKFDHEGLRYQHWLSLTCWTALPALLDALAAWVLILSGNGQVPLTALTPLSLGGLLGIPALQSLSLPMLWSIVLLILGYQAFSGGSLNRSAIIVLAPVALIFGIIIWFF